MKNAQALDLTRSGYGDALSYVSLIGRNFCAVYGKSLLRIITGISHKRHSNFDLGSCSPVYLRNQTEFDQVLGHFSCLHHPCKRARKTELPQTASEKTGKPICKNVDFFPTNVQYLDIELNIR